MATFYISVVMVASFTHSVSAGASVTEMVGNLKSFRSGIMDVFDTAKTSLKDLGKDEDASVVEKWSNDWLSLLGTSTGLTGLASDFVLNHLGRSSYHSRNGPLIGAIQRTSRIIPDMDGKDSVEQFRKGVLEICLEGKKLFKKNGALHNMLAGLQDLLHRKASSEVLSKSVGANAELYRAMKFFSGDVSIDASESSGTGTEL